MSKKEKKTRSLRQILLASLGKAWLFWPPRLAVKKRCKHPTRAGWYICELNQNHIVEKIDVDHIIPCIRPADGFISWDDYIESRFVEDPKLLQGICTACHKEKSKQENLVRKLKKKKQREVTSKDLDIFAQRFPKSKTIDTGTTLSVDANESESSGC